MEYTKTPAGIMIPKSNEFDLMQTLDCGQSFRWEPCNEKIQPNWRHSIWSIFRTGRIGQAYSILRYGRRRLFTYMGPIF